jgi:hypothetical protein
MMAIAPGTRIGSYEILGSLGAGGPAYAHVRCHLASFGASTEAKESICQ